MVRLWRFTLAWQLRPGFDIAATRSCHAERLPCCVWSPDRGGCAPCATCRAPPRWKSSSRRWCSIKTTITPDGQTVQSLGREREGSGVIIDEDGLILTIGYLMVEAHAAEVRTNAGRTVPATVVGYDHETGFGILKTIEPLKIKPLSFGRSADVKPNDPVLIASHGGTGSVGPAYVAAKREFAGSWEYLLEEAIFTTPPYPNWSGAALISREGKLLGVGSLIVGDAGGDGSGKPGNMFVPVEKLPPILGDLIADGHVAGPARPWLGVAADEVRGRLLVSRVTPGGPGEKAGIRRGDEIVGVAGAAPRGLGGFLPQGLGHRDGRRDRAARYRERRREAAHRRQVDEPARSSEAEVDAVTLQKLSNLDQLRHRVHVPRGPALRGGYPELRDTDSIRIVLRRSRARRGASLPCVCPSGRVSARRSVAAHRERSRPRGSARLSERDWPSARPPIRRASARRHPQAFPHGPRGASPAPILPSRRMLLLLNTTLPLAM